MNTLLTITHDNITKYWHKPQPHITKLVWRVCRLSRPVLANFPNVTEFDCSNTQLAHLRGIERLTKLKVLRMPENYVRTVSALAGMNLLELYCNGNMIHSLTGLESSVDLQILHCQNNVIPSFVPIKDCVNLQVLCCQGNRYVSIRDLANCVNLVELNWSSCMGNEQFPVFPLLTKLVCMNSRLSSLTLLNCPNLVYLNCRGNNLTDLEGIDKLRQLQTLICSSNNIASLDGISECTQLEVLDCQNNMITSIEPVLSLANLRIFGCMKNRLAADDLTISKLEHLPNFYHGLAPISKGIDGGYSSYSTSIYSWHTPNNRHVQYTVYESIGRLQLDPEPCMTMPELLADIKGAGVSTRICGILAERCNTTKPIQTTKPITYAELLAYVWNRIKASEHNEELVKIFSEQVSDSAGVCMGGACARLVSVLAGFDDDIVIGISESDRIIAIIESIRKKRQDYSSVILAAEVNVCLQEIGYSKEEAEPWVTAVINAHCCY